MTSRLDSGAPRFAAFDRQFFTGKESFTLIGSGAVGGKARGLASVKNLLAERIGSEEFPGIETGIPRLAVLGTAAFDTFLEENDLLGIAMSGAPDDRIAHAFQRGNLPAALLGDLRALVEQVRSPLAIRSSSLLEDELAHPFAGVYATKMIPNNQFDADIRFRKLVEAIKFVYASTFFRSAQSYLGATGRRIDEEKMAVVIQEIVGLRHAERFYPDVSGVARSWNFYAFGSARPEDGVVSLALGLGKTIVDGGRSWSYSPRLPRSMPPFNNLGDLLDNTQTQFWAVNMGEPPAYDPVAETEYMVLSSIVDAERDGRLPLLVSTYDPQADRLNAGIRGQGPRALTFAPLLGSRVVPLNDLVQRLLDICKEEAGSDVEIEFALTLSETDPVLARFGFLQVRPMAVSRQRVDVSPEKLASPAALVASDLVLGNGVRSDIRDLIYLKPNAFDPAATHAIASELESVNRTLLQAARPYLLIGFGRWGTSDARLGIPVTWGQISGARVIVEALLPRVDPDPSQGSHFFHNLTSFQVPYFTVRYTGPHRVRWDWLDAQPAVLETRFLRHITLAAPLRVEVDGRTGRGVVTIPES